MKQILFALGVIVILIPVNFQAQDIFCRLVSQESVGPLSNLNTFPVFGGRYLPSTGVVRALVVFAQLKDHATSDQNWPVNSLPNWAASFVDSVADGNYPVGSLSQRYHQWSGGSFPV